LKYYLRGLGIGVIVAAVLMGIALGGDKEKMTDAEIMARAKALGMVESSVLADLNKEKENKEAEIEEPESMTDESTKETEPATEPSVEPESESAVVPDKDPKKDTESEPESENESKPEMEPESKPDSEPESDAGQEPEADPPKREDAEYVILVIERGESSVSVSRSLEELGLVESAKEYDKFLCNNGYDKYIRVGTHKIKAGSTDEEIANIISRKKN